ncbi:MAG: FkbM family methyltransferase [Myxococcales bacterium]|nr:FkbM family methyltransferase [Myxococcales bacterium]
MRSPAVLLRDFQLAPLQAAFERLEVRARAAQLAQLASAPRYADERCLARYGYRCTSQNDEDGIIDEIFRRIGTTNRQFVEFGVQTGVQNNTLALLLGGWSGLWIEADGQAAATIRGSFAEPLASGQLRLIEAFVTAETIDEQFERGRVPAEPDLLSIDIDGNDYWVWKAITRARPRVVVIEYNASLGRSAKVVRPYDPQARWDGTLAFGASLGALEALGTEKGYCLVGCNITGVNAFFVRADCVGEAFLAPYTAARHYEPPRYGTTGTGHPARWARFDPV